MAEKLDFIIGNQEENLDQNSIMIGTLFDDPIIDMTKENEIHFLTVIKAPEIKNDFERTNLSLIACLDISGSMIGSKLNSLKETVIKMIQNLTKNDVLGIVAFGSMIHEILIPLNMTRENKLKAINEIKKLKTEGMTNLSGGFLKSVEFLNSIQNKNSIKRILVFTDGQANAGICDPQQLNDLIKERIENNTLSTFGFGANYNSELLDTLSDACNGNNYHIQISDDIPEAFARELGGLLSVYAQNIKIEFLFENNIEVLDDFIDFQKKSENNKIVVSIPDIYSEEIRNLIFKLKVPIFSSETKLTIASVSVSYFNVLEKCNQTKKTIARISLVPSSQVLEKVDINPYMMEQLVVAKAGRAQKNAIELSNKGLFQEAQNVLNEAILYAESTSSGGIINFSNQIEDLRNFMRSTQDQVFYSSNLNHLRAQSKSYTKSRSYTATSYSKNLDNSRQVAMMENFKLNVKKEDKENGNG